MAMAFSLSLTSLSLPLSPPLHHHHPNPSSFTPLSLTKKPQTNLSFPSKSFFGCPLTTTLLLSSPSPLPHKASPSTTSFAVYAAKGYKMKTHKASAKRFRVTGRGKIVRRCAGKQHLLGKKNTKRKKRLSKMALVNKSDYDNVVGALPYLKVNRKAA